jgi:hypothetical protein
LRKTGRCIQQAFYRRDPLSPPFHVNLMLGLRFWQASLRVPLHRGNRVGARALPIAFEEVSRVKRPGRKASAEMQQPYPVAVKVEPVAQLCGHGAAVARGIGSGGRRRQDSGVNRRWQLL